MSLQRLEWITENSSQEEGNVTADDYHLDSPSLFPNNANSFLSFSQSQSQSCIFQQKLPRVVQLTSMTPTPPQQQQQQSQGNSNANCADQTTNDVDDITPDQVIHRIEELSKAFFFALDKKELPVLRTYREPSKKCYESSDEETDDDTEDGEVSISSILRNNIGNNNKELTKQFNGAQCRSFTSISLVLNFCKDLLQSNQTTTMREVYYFYVTHFRSQRECDTAIAQSAELLKVPRHSLGLKASPRGWWCGDLQLVCKETGRVDVDGRRLASIQGAPTASQWLLSSHKRPWKLQTTSAECILVIEKEGVYHRLAEDRFFDDYPCILVTGKGFPDLATRAMVCSCWNELKLPVRGLADCDPYGVLVLNCYQHGSRSRRGVDGGARFEVPMQWVGLRPSQIRALQDQEDSQDEDEDDGSSSNSRDAQSPNARKHRHQYQSLRLPEAVFQELTEHDQRRLDRNLLRETCSWTGCGQDERRLEELEDMRESGYKVELEALNWLGMDYAAKWLGDIFDYQRQLEQGHDEGMEWMELL